MEEAAAVIRVTVRMEVKAEAAVVMEVTTVAAAMM